MVELNRERVLADEFWTAHYFETEFVRWSLVDFLARFVDHWDLLKSVQNLLFVFNRSRLRQNTFVWVETYETGQRTELRTIAEGNNLRCYLGLALNPVRVSVGTKRDCSEGSVVDRYLISWFWPLVLQSLHRWVKALNFKLKGDRGCFCWKFIGRQYHLNLVKCIGKSRRLHLEDTIGTHDNPRGQSIAIGKRSCVNCLVIAAAPSWRSLHTSWRTELGRWESFGDFVRKGPTWNAFDVTASYFNVESPSSCRFVVNCFVLVNIRGFCDRDYFPDQANVVWCENDILIFVICSSLIFSGYPRSVVGKGNNKLNIPIVRCVCLLAVLDFCSCPELSPC